MLFSDLVDCFGNENLRPKTSTHQAVSISRPKVWEKQFDNCINMFKHKIGQNVFYSFVSATYRLEQRHIGHAS